MTGIQADFFGRKKSLTLINVLFLVSYIIMATAQSFQILIIGRVLQGWAFGSHLIQVPIYTCEILQPKMRACNGSISVITGMLGFAMTLTMGALGSWRMLLWINAGMCGLTLVLQGLLLNESHVWLVEKKREEEAWKVLFKLRGNEDVAKEELSKIKANIHEREILRHQANKEFTRFGMLKHLLTTGTFVRPFIVVLIVQTVGTAWVGIEVVNQFFVMLLDLNKVPMDPYKTAAGIAWARTILSLVFLVSLTNVKRVKLFVSSMIIIAVGNTIIGINGLFNFNGELQDVWIGFKWLPLAGFSVFYMGFTLFIIILLQIAGEILPSNARGIGSGIVSVIASLVKFGTVVAVPTIINTIGISAMFMIFAGFSFALALFGCLCIPETHGKSLEEIEGHYRRIVYGKDWNKEKRRESVQSCASIQNFDSKCGKFDSMPITGASISSCYCPETSSTNSTKM